MKAKYFSIAAGLLLMALSSCNDFLDKTPDTRVYLVNVEQLRQLMVDGYMGTNIAQTCELSSDNIVDNNAPPTLKTGMRYNLKAYSLSDEQLFAWDDVDKANDNDTPSGVWQGCYGAIAVCNAVLQKVAEFEEAGADANGVLSQDDKAKLSAVKGEALVSRAFHHWMLAQVFCMPYGTDEQNRNDYKGLPYVTEPETLVNPQYDRGNLADFYEKIESDLLEGLPLINNLYYEIPKYHFNKQAANAFAARFYLFERKYNLAVHFANEAFQGADPATLLNDIWRQDDFYYISDIGRYATSIERPGNWMLVSSNSTWWRCFVSSGRFACNGVAKRATIQGPGPSWEDCKYENSRTGEKFAMNPSYNGYCGSAGGSDYGVYYAGNCFEQFEYSDKLAGIGYCHEIRAEFTAEETLLVRAEAYIMMVQLAEGFADLHTWDENHRNNLNQTSSYKELTDALVINFYTKAMNKYNQYKPEDPQNYNFGIAKPIHIDEVCATPKSVEITYENGKAKTTETVMEAWKVTPEKLPYLQCVQHFRRMELIHTGMRWLDIKRFGLNFYHTYRSGDDTYTEELKTLDERYAIQIPYQTIVAGFDPNDRKKVAPPVEDPVEDTSAYIVPSQD
ncbi:MAG: RagB/SusD family nutrient uptake outer membrane protein [Muribaculaceae bacterium]|nr:RagB/SusD family nutrient uptake outer membrane protein [Muribaculaceae bacterium]